MFIEEYKGDTYYIRNKYDEPHNDYLRIEWSTGYIEIKRYYWDRLSERKKRKFLDSILSKSPSVETSHVALAVSLKS